MYDDLREEIKDNGHIVTNIWNIKKQDTTKTLPTFYVKLKPENNNKDIYEIKSLFKCKIKYI
jgi:hypothetical protein